MLPHKLASMTLQEAQANGYLAPLHPDAPLGTHVITSDDRLNEIKSELQHNVRTESSEPVNERQIHEEAIYQPRLESLKKVIAPGKRRQVDKTIVFCSRVADAERLREFTGAGICSRRL